MRRLEDLQSANAAWVEMVRTVLTTGAECKPRGLTIKEILCHTTHVNMAKCITTRRPKLGYKFLAAEAWWILTGRNDAASIKAYSPHIETFSNNVGTFDGAYGPKIVDQLRYVVDSLVADRDTRQAVLSIWRPNPRQSKDVPCTITIQWLIREHTDGAGVSAKYLDCIDTMRSSDAWLGWPYDIFNFSMLSAYIALFVRLFTGEDIKLGTLHLTAGSQHLYLHPKKEGADNVPYSIDDVRNMLQDPNYSSSTVAYAPIDLDEFENPGDLLHHLELCKDKRGTKKWMREFQR